MQREVWLPDEDDPNREKYVEVWYSGNRRRIETYIMKRVQGPKWEDNYENHLANLLERCGDLVFPDNYKDKIIKEIRAPHGEIIKVYDTDRHVVIGRVKDDYCIDEDLRKMLEIIHNVKDSNKRNALFIDDLYKIDDRIAKFHRIEHVRK